MRCSVNRLLQLATKPRLQSMRSDTSSHVWPSASSKISRARRASSARSVRLLARRVNSISSEFVNVIAPLMVAIIVYKWLLRSTSRNARSLTMPRTCTACTHPHRDDIDRLLLEGVALRNISKRFSLSAAGLFRHNKHVSTTLANSHKEAEVLRADGLLEHLHHLTAETARLTEKAEKAKDYRTALAGVRERSEEHTP